MMASIGTITDLHENLALPGIKNLQQRAGETRWTLGGRPVVDSIPLEAGQLITLEEETEYGLFTTTQVDAINAYKASGEEVTFSHNMGTWQVIVEETNFTQSEGLTDPGPDDTWYGSVTMRIMS